jgi:hypothetical protein
MAMTLATSATPASTNTGWGFYGTMGGHAEAAWPIAMAAIAEATGCDVDETRAFLDSRHGRHFADEVHGHLEYGMPLAKAITATTARLMEQTVGRRTARAFDLPAGMPYLTAFVVAAGIAEELEAA